MSTSLETNDADLRVRVPSELRDRLEAIARANDWALASTLRCALARFASYDTPRPRPADRRSVLPTRFSSARSPCSTPLRAS